MIKPEVRWIDTWKEDHDQAVINSVESGDTHAYMMFFKRYTNYGAYTRDQLNMNLRKSDRFLLGQLARICVQIPDAPQSAKDKAEQILNEMEYLR